MVMWYDFFGLMILKINLLLQGLISTTFLQAAFKCEDPKSAKRQSSHECLFVILGSAHVKASVK